MLNLNLIFPKQPRFAAKSAQLVLELLEHGPQHQTNLCKTLELSPYEMTRILDHLSAYVFQQQDGKTKIVNLVSEFGGL